MLCQFTFKNFKSYRDETTLDFQAAPIKEFSESLLKTEGASGSFLPVAVIYGPNGGGKSGVLEAFERLVRMVAAPVEFLEFADADLRVPVGVSGFRPFKFDKESRDLPAEFEIFFRTNGSEYRYTLSCVKDRIFEESLHRRSLSGTKPAMLFSRSDGIVSMGRSLKGELAKTPAVSARMPLLSFLFVNYDMEEIDEVVEWFTSCEFVNCAASKPFRFALSQWEQLETKRADIERLLDQMDVGIDGYRLIRKEIEEGDYRHVRRKLLLEHEVGGNVYLLDSREESAGTQRLLELLPSILVSLQQGSLLVVDELDDRLHPKLLKQIISFYKDPNINIGGGQLLFTSHDVCTMRNSVFRRDEIWFAAKDDTESSMLYSLYEIRDEDGGAVKATAAYDKQYLEGRYGADPYFERMKGWSGDVE